MADSDSDIENEEDDPWAEALGEQAAGEGKDPDAYLNNEEESVASSPNVSEAFDAAGLSDLVDESEDEEDELPSSDKVELNMILDIPVIISMEIGRTEISIRNLLKLNQGSVVELDRLAGEPLDVLVNGTLIAHGEVVVVNEKFGIRLTDVITAAERVQKLT
ncbi:MAG TPA: flagellar motor switch protein FliN [Gammaproteobacteria bacterium]|nr:flagellar motor switch protein FliN [Gammaproteobacteria bacterium]